MALQVSTSEIDPSYNGSVGVGSGELTTTLDQYWTERRAAYAENVERLRPLAADTEAERKWHDFCAYRTGPWWNLRRFHSFRSRWPAQLEY